ncbi:sigma-70 family RNA polymerase sigma factor [Sporosarcina sp. PTS2304]|uniref:sigma-70 family RNA polymerase sigma factor n=1 Tax=Sporosarcina sp. PTS2304 TaxID=2283194 RepID=UPI000E0CC1B5|nr:sigma-70 family RNA polymerase sigma factor [Sporosarcina sp. PTS2304]AXH98469.1 sigma-70 family RNA polymerase sigma factor [Sporosarcina sp. PTS2304]
MENFEDVLKQYEPMISAVIRKLSIYREFEHFRQIGRIALWQAWNRFDETKGNFTPFAYRSIYGALLDELKSETRVNEAQTPVETNTMEVLAGHTLDWEEEDVYGLHAAIKSLPLEQRQLLIMLYVENKTQTECAKHFGITVPGIKKRRERILKRLKDHLLQSIE